MSRFTRIAVGVVALAIAVAFVARFWQACSARSLGQAVGEEFSGEIAVGLREETLVVRFLEEPDGGIVAARARIDELVAEHFAGYAEQLDVAVCDSPDDHESGRKWCAQLREEEE